MLASENFTLREILDHTWPGFALFAVIGAWAVVLAALKAFRHGNSSWP
jgi:hypothetical protein